MIVPCGEPGACWMGWYRYPGADGCWGEYFGPDDWRAAAYERAATRPCTPAPRYWDKPVWDSWKFWLDQRFAVHSCKSA